MLATVEMCAGENKILSNDVAVVIMPTAVGGVVSTLRTKKG